MALERALGYEPQDVSTENRGYDIESCDPKTGSLRFIEVKGRRADADSITITRNEMLAAFNASNCVHPGGGAGGWQSFVDKPLYCAESCAGIRAGAGLQRGSPGHFHESHYRRRAGGFVNATEHRSP